MGAKNLLGYEFNVGMSRKRVVGLIRARSMGRFPNPFYVLVRNLNDAGGRSDEGSTRHWKDHGYAH